MVIWITGKANSGKTAIARKLAHAIPNGVVVDADAVRKRFPCGFDDVDRAENISRIANIAALLEVEGAIPIVACMSPKKQWREEARTLFKDSVLLYIPGGELWEGTTYETPDDQELA